MPVLNRSVKGLSHAQLLSRLRELTVRDHAHEAELIAYLGEVDQQHGASSRPRPAGPSRKIPAAIRRAVWERDTGRCSFVSREGRLCGTREFLEFHHKVPWARRREHRVSNIHLHCRSHNHLAAELDFGPQPMAAFRGIEDALAAERTAAERASAPEP